MKYILGLIFEFKYYKNPANMKIFSNNRLIDDIDLTEDIKNKEILPPTLHENTHLYNWWKTWSKDMYKHHGDGSKAPFANLPELPITDKVFVYTLDETILQDSIKIEITNDNSNYSNGFMTKWSSFIFHDLFLIPTHYLDFEKYNEFVKKQQQIRDRMPDPAPEIASQVHPSFQLFEKQFIEEGGSLSFEFPIIEYEKGLKILGPSDYEQLSEIEKIRLITNSRMPLYFKHLKLINTQNETA